MRSHTAMSWPDRRQRVRRRRGIVHRLEQPVTVGTQHVQHAAVHHPVEVPFVEVTRRRACWLRRLRHVPVSYRLLLFGIRRAFFPPPVFRLVPAGFRAVPLPFAMAGRLEFSAAYLANHLFNLSPITPFHPFATVGRERHCTRGGRGGHGRGPRPGLGQIPNVLNGNELAFNVRLPSSSDLACSSVLSLFNLLQMR